MVDDIKTGKPNWRKMLDGEMELNIPTAEGPSKLLNQYEPASTPEFLRKLRKDNPLTYKAFTDKVEKISDTEMKTFIKSFEEQMEEILSKGAKKPGERNINLDGGIER